MFRTDIIDRGDNYLLQASFRASTVEEISID
jgi:hypothetical protein